jgi:hypothetical protein
MRTDPQLTRDSHDEESSGDEPVGASLQIPAR